MPKLVLPVVHKTKVSTIELRPYEKGKAAHVRALARYFFRHVHGHTFAVFIKMLLPSLTHDQLENIGYVRLRNLADMKLDQIEEVSKSILPEGHLLREE